MTEPSSHDDLNTPLYRGELIMLLKDIEDLEKVKKADITSPAEVGRDSFHFETSTSIGVLSADFVFLERFSIIKKSDLVYYSNSEIKVTYCTLQSWNNRKGKLRRFLRDMSSRAGMEPNNAYDCVINPRLHLSLKDLGERI